MKAFTSHLHAVVFGISALVVLVAAIVFVLIFWDLQPQAARLLAWFESTGLQGHVGFVVLYALVVVFLLPGVVLTTGAGFLFGTFLGSFYVLVGTAIGASIAFLLAKHCFAIRARRLLEKYPQLDTLVQIIADQPWQIVMLTRMIPLFPFKVSNYAFGSMPISWRAFVLGTMIGIIPFTLTNVYAGSLAADLAHLQAGSLQRSPLEWLLYALGLLLLLGCLFFVTKRARAKLLTIQKQQAEGRERVA